MNISIITTMSYNDIIESFGVGIILVAYFLNVFSFKPKKGKFYFTLNIIGTSITCFSSVLINYFTFIIFEGTLVILCLFGLF
ncbi:hypothetical protein [Flavobacterium sp. IMCC34518]|uniref:hypothetical protein n=1 Tax=Flavobacterium sp. IMCC34518 TaxID=3003623 RepID=UPI0022ABFFAA|nr:hypothetical protein [Flavobacterium sp. IMCC34518]